jgi:hypothetical protein
MKFSKRALLVVGALAALLPFGAVTAEAAVTENTITMGGAGTPIESAIRMYVQRRAAAEKWSPEVAQIAREQLQLQFMSLSAADQQKVLAAAQNLNSEEGVAQVVKVLADAVQSIARQVVADLAADGAKSRSGQQIQPKLGTTGADLVFVPTAGPCRVADTRFGIYVDWPGPIAAFAARQIYVYSIFAGYDWSAYQGGTGVAGSGNCAGDVFTTVAPVAVVVTLSVTNTSSQGALRAWDGTTSLTTGAALTWMPYGTQANTTVVPINRGGTIYPGSGPFKKDIGVYNNSGSAIDVIADVVGFYIESTATPLECTSVFGASTPIPAFTSVFISAPACPAGYRAMNAQPSTGVYGLFLGTLWDTACRIGNFTSGSLSATCDAFCCRVPGR